MKKTRSKKSRDTVPFKVRLEYCFLISESFDYLFLVELYWIRVSNSGILVDRNMFNMQFNSDLGKAMTICYIFTGHFRKHKG
jgi:hypothetical protein